MNRADHLTGMMLGHLVGDALGSAYEFGARFKAKAPDPVMARGVFGHPKGSGTDDTEVARCCARTVIATGGFDPGYYAEQLTAWKHTGPKDIGGQTSRAIRAWVATGRAPAMDPQAQGNGALMGCAPLAALPLHQAVPAATALSRATHPSPASMAACARYVELLWCIVNEKVYVIPEPDREAQGWEPDHTNIGWVLGAEKLAYDSLATAARAGDPTRVLLDVVRLGGDTDTNAAIAGAVLGAAYGPDAFATLVPELLDSDRALNEGLAQQLAAL